MRTILLTILLSVLCAAAALPQSGPGRADPPKKKPRAKPDTTRVEPASADTTASAPKDTAKAAPEKKPPKQPAEEPREQPRTAPPPPEPIVPATRSGFSNYVPRAILCRDVVGHEPVGVLDSVVTDADTVTFFTELVGLAGKTVSHRWKHNGEVMAEVPIHVGGPHWRAYSRKSLLPAWAGRWTVEVVDPDTRVLVRRSFVYRPATEP